MSLAFGKGVKGDLFRQNRNYKTCHVSNSSHFFIDTKRASSFHVKIFTSRTQPQTWKGRILQTFWWWQPLLTWNINAMYNTAKSPIKSEVNYFDRTFQRLRGKSFLEEDLEGRTLTNLNPYSTVLPNCTSVQTRLEGSAKKCWQHLSKRRTACNTVYELDESNSSFSCLKFKARWSEQKCIKYLIGTELEVKFWFPRVSCKTDDSKI